MSFKLVQIVDLPRLCHLSLLVELKLILLLHLLVLGLVLGINRIQSMAGVHQRHVLVELAWVEHTHRGIVQVR